MFYIYSLEFPNERFYIGQHKYNNSVDEDNYLGSGGKILKDFKKKYVPIKHIIIENIPGGGAANFLETITIEEFRNKYGKEKILNVSNGPFGGNYGKEWADGVKKTLKEKWKNKKIQHTEEQRKIMSEAAKKYWTEENKLKRSEVIKRKHIEGSYGEETYEKWSRTEENKKRLKEIQLKNSKSQKQKEYMSKIFSGSGNPMFGKQSPNRKKVRCIETQEEFSSIAEAGKLKNIDKASINHVCLKDGKIKTAGGFHWEYVDDEHDKKNGFK